MATDRPGIPEPAVPPVDSLALQHDADDDYWNRERGAFSDLLVAVIGYLKWPTTIAATTLLSAATLAALGVMLIVIAVPVMLVIDAIGWPWNDVLKLDEKVAAERMYNGIKNTVIGTLLSTSAALAAVLFRRR